jgi:hypothetical protein
LTLLVVASSFILYVMHLFGINFGNVCCSCAGGDDDLFSRKGKNKRKNGHGEEWHMGSWHLMHVGNLIRSRKQGRCGTEASCGGFNDGVHFPGEAVAHERKMAQQGVHGRKPIGGSAWRAEETDQRHKR